MRWPIPVDTRIAATGALCVSLCVISIPEAEAGRLGKVTKSISDKTGGSKGRSGGGGGGSSDHDSRSSKSNNTTMDVGIGGCMTCAPVAPASAAASAGARNPASPTRPEIDLYLGGHRVKESDGAIAGSVRVRSSVLAIEFADTSYYERRPTLSDPDDYIRMDMWSLNLQARVAQVEGLSVWALGGVGASSSTEFESLLGPMLGARVVKDLTPGLAIEGGGRYYFLEKDVSALELRAVLRASVFTIGYRRLAFDVGPPLEGPEAGISLSF